MDDSLATPRPMPSLEQQRRLFWKVVAGAAAGVAVLAVLLQPTLLPDDVRNAASSLGLLASGLFLAASCWRRSRLTLGRRRRSWRLILSAAAVALAGNAWAALAGSDPVSDPSTISNVSIIIGLTLGIAGLLNFPVARRRGADLVVIVLDGLVIGSAVLIVASNLVYSELLDRTQGTLGSQVATLVIPVLDVVLAVVALLLLLRSSGSDRGALLLLALGNISYVLADLPFAVLVATEDFTFGTPLDLGWILGYVLLALAAWYPSVLTDEPEDTETPTSVGDTTLVFAVLMVAAVVQVAFGANENLDYPTALLWLVLVIAAATRQIVLTRDNQSLRRGLEARVREQTVDLLRLARQTEVLLTSVGDGIYGVDADGRVTFVNPSGASALSYAPAELLGRNPHDVFHAPAHDGAAYPYDGCYVADAIRDGIVTAAEEDVYVRADGSSFPVEITASPVVEDDTVRGAVVVFRDVTQRREVDRMKNEFLSVVSHELRTPLTSILGSLELLDSGVLGELSPRAQAMTTTALESSERLTRLINDILDLDRIQSGNRAMRVAPVDARELLTRSVTEMAGLSSSTGVHIDVGTTAGRVSVDSDMIVQTLTNLLGNAVKFSSSGQRVVADAVQRDGQVLFRVHDRGRGIPPDKLETIFQRFEQVDSSDSRQMGGTGLGLAISRGIVERHGGRIWAESSPEGGTTVQFTLPSVAASRVTDHDRPASREQPAGPSGADPRGAGGVLVVEDDRDLAAVLETLLAAKGLPVTSTGGVVDALRAAADAPPRVVVLDVRLPDGDGYTVIDALRRDRRAADTDVVVYSAVEVTGEHRARLTLGRTVFITKGRVEPAAVAERVAELMSSQHHHQGGTRS